MKNFLVFITITLLLCSIIITNSCKKCHPYVSANPCDTLSHTFSNDIDTMILNSCAALGAGCHGAGSTNAGGPLTNYSEISAKAAAIQTSVNSGMMPPQGLPGLTDEEKNKLNCWINEGAPNN